MSIEDRMHQVLGRLSETEALGFEDLFADGDGSRPFMIVTFLALLEMIRLKLIRVFQSGGIGPIRVYKRARPSDAPHPIGDPATMTMTNYDRRHVNATDHDATAVAARAPARQR